MERRGPLSRPPEDRLVQGGLAGVDHPVPEPGPGGRLAGQHLGGGGDQQGALDPGGLHLHEAHVVTPPVGAEASPTPGEAGEGDGQQRQRRHRRHRGEHPPALPVLEGGRHRQSRSHRRHRQHRLLELGSEDPGRRQPPEGHHPGDPGRSPRPGQHPGQHGQGEGGERDGVEVDRYRHPPDQVLDPRQGVRHRHQGTPRPDQCHQRAGRETTDRLHRQGEEQRHRCQPGNERRHQPDRQHRPAGGPPPFPP